jgi:hypothetical protein
MTKQKFRQLKMLAQTNRFNYWQLVILQYLEKKNKNPKLLFTFDRENKDLVSV